MTRGNEALVRTGLTAGAVLVGVAILWQTDYDYDFGQVWEYRAMFAKGIALTVVATLAAYALGLVAGVIVALGRLSRGIVTRHMADLYVEVIRGTPFLVQLSIAYFGVAPLVGIDNKVVVGAIALGLFAAAYIGEIFRAGIESIERGQVEAARSLGMTRAATMRHVVFPQAFRRMVPPLTGELIALTKESSLLFFIGVFELMAAGKQAASNTYDVLESYLFVAGLYLCITVPLSLLARGLERRLGSGDVRGSHL